uniref:Uncharacterized protein n=1 Tax=Nothobranchius furzeri TaxID=105023 RepID=A0A1A7ZJY6_NOTFU
MEKKRSKPSGAQFRKKRKEEEEKRDKDRDALLKFLCPSPANPPIASTSAEQLSSDVAASCTPPVASTSAAHLSSDAATSSTSSASPIDPADWPSPLTDKTHSSVWSGGVGVIWEGTLMSSSPCAVSRILMGVLCAYKAGVFTSGPGGPPSYIF